MKLVFAGTPQAAVPSLAALAGSDHDVTLVLTREDAPLGRKRVLTPSPVAATADALGLPVLKTNRLGDEATDAVTGADLGVIVAYGGLVREPLLSAPRLGWINLHFSLLPRWRGAAPVQRALIAGDDVTGAAVFQLVPELDAGPVFGRVTHPVGAADTSGDLLDVLSLRGADLLLQVVAELAAGTVRAVPQTGEVTLAPKLTLDDARIDWSAAADAIGNRIRGVTPEPGAFTTIGDARLKIAEAAPAADAASQPPGHIRLVDGRVLVGTGTHPLELRRVQPAGKKPMPATDWWRGVAAAELVAS
ncbi:methionyl-tRNA formyltransferase [Cryobacterium tepidiphilum]|uniref:Methionyl-tRNA formyltransferase n=1 Tax=Cryobacterium tepidiphilum TaxID=2486026 RepID=A0A3M8LNU5_9MICO|nr:methionyl-tRNA formyltransferase [Cryobacterium tepidiphilum]RNE66542.1 methionyl-tRNA formyltransferase [Cryobacterium tepidiphilum]